MGGGLAFEDENAYKGREGVQKGHFFADVLIECPLMKTPDHVKPLGLKFCIENSITSNPIANSDI